MQGRFSGRLETKEDEKRLAEECRRIGPLLGGAFSGEMAMQTLAKIVRGIAAGDVRTFLEAQDRELRELRQHVEVLSASDMGQEVQRLYDDNLRLREQLEQAQLELAAAGMRAESLAAAAEQHGQFTAPLPLSLPAPTLAPAVAQQVAGQAVGVAMARSASQAVLLPSALQQAPQLQPIMQAGGTLVQPPAADAAANAAAAAFTAQQQVQSLAGPQPQVVVAAVPQSLAQPAMSVLMQAGSGMQQALVQAGGGMQPTLVHAGSGVPQALVHTGSGIQQAPPVVTSLSSGQLAPVQTTSAVQHHLPTLTAVSGDGHAEAAAPASATAVVAGEAAQNLNQQAHNLAVQANLHEQAKAQAHSEAQRLASHAQLHAEASMQAAVQAEQLKRTLAGGSMSRRLRPIILALGGLRAGALLILPCSFHLPPPWCRAARDQPPGARGVHRAAAGGAGQAACGADQPGGAAGAGPAGDGAGARPRAGQGHCAGHHAAGPCPVAAGLGAAD